jgi:hypothetical protein
MSRARNRTKNRGHKHLRQQARKAQAANDVIQDTAAVFTCSKETAADFASQCERALDDLDVDLRFNQVAHELWAGRPGRAQELAAALAAFAQERERHIAALRQVQEQLQALVADESYHEHLDPPEAYRDFVRQRLFPDSASASTT